MKMLHDLKHNAAAMLVACGLSLFAFCATAAAATGISFTDAPNNWNSGENIAVGWSFSANQDMLVDALGFYAAPDFFTGERTLTESHDVAILDASGAFLAYTTVQASDPLSGFFRWHTLDSALQLTKGADYYILAIVGQDQYTWDPTGFSVNPSITFGQNYWVDLNTYDIYADDSSTIGYFGPNFHDASAVPVPAALWLLASGLGGLTVLRRKQG